MADPSVSRPAAGEAPGKRRFAADVNARLSPEVQKRLRQTRWTLRLTSLWAPVTVFGLAFALYLLIVESHTPSAQWAQPALKGFGLLMLVWFFGLIPLRQFWRPLSHSRKLRHQAFELTDEVEALCDKHHDAVTGKPRDELVESSAALQGAVAGTDDAALEAQLKLSAGVADKHLVRWRKQSTFDLGMGFVKAFAIAMIIRTVLIEPFRIPSGSMIPTLEIGDQIFVNKFIYGVRIPFTNYVPFTIVRPPERGDVIVFNNPKDTSVDFIKRVIGVGGDKIEIIDGIVHVNDVPQPRELIDDRWSYWDREVYGWQQHDIRLYRERLDDKTYVSAQNLPGYRSPSSPTGPFHVPPGHVFVMGDNRDNSSDSRVGFVGLGTPPAYVPLGNIKGKAMVIWLALGWDGLGKGLFGGTGLKTERFFLPVR